MKITIVQYVDGDKRGENLIIIVIRRCNVISPSELVFLVFLIDFILLLIFTQHIFVQREKAAKCQYICQEPSIKSYALTHTHTSDGLFENNCLSKNICLNLDEAHRSDLESEPKRKRRKKLKTRTHSIQLLDFFSLHSSIYFFLGEIFIACIIIASVPELFSF